MTKKLILLQKMIVLSHALNIVIVSNAFISSIERIRENTQHKRDSKCGLDFSKKLVDLMYAMAENAQQVLEHLDSVLQQERTIYPYECTVRPISDKDHTIIESAVLSQRDWLMFFYRLDLLTKHVFIDDSIPEKNVNYEEISKDNEAQEILGALSDILATLNVVWDITEHIYEILDEITSNKADSLLYLPLEAYVYDLMDKRNRIYRHLFDHLKKTSNYTINSNVIMKSRNDVYTGRNILELMNYDLVFKPQPAFDKIPDKITFIYKSGYTKVLFQR